MTSATDPPRNRSATGDEAIITRLEELGLGPWDVIVLLATVVLAILMPIEAVIGTLDATWLIVLSAVISVLLIIDIRRRYLAQSSAYLSGWFTVDLLAAIPFDLVAEIPAVASTPLESAFRLLALTRVLRVARLFVLQRKWRVQTSFNPAVLRLVFVGFWIALVAHWIASGWIAIDGFESGPADLPPYQSALYWTITTLTTVGYGDITPIGVGQTYYTMATMALGAAMYGYIIGNVASLLANLDVLRSRHLQRVETVNHFMRDRDIPRDLQAKVRNYYNYLWDSRIGQEAEILDDLPKPLHVEVALYTHRNILERVPLFAGAGEDFFRELVLELEPMVFLPGQRLMRRGEVGHELYFIDKGTVEVLAPDNSHVIAVLGDGDFVGEMALLADQPRANTVTAVDYCNVYALNRAGFNHVLEDFPEVAAEVRRVAEQRRGESDPRE